MAITISIAGPFDTEFAKIVKSNPHLREKIQKQIRFLAQGQPWHPSLKFEYLKGGITPRTFKVWVDRNWRIIGVHKKQENEIHLYHLRSRQEAYER